MERSLRQLAMTIQLLLSLMMSCLANQTPNINTDQSALLAFKSQITSDPFQFLSKNWTSNSSSVCNWIGITCGSRHQRVTSLEIPNMSLVGTLSPFLGNLSLLISLNLMNNSFHGNLPHQLSNLHRLKSLNFSNNVLSGSIPDWISSLTELRVLVMANNQFSGIIPTSLSNLSKLEGIYLTNNSLEGIIPKGIGKLYQLKTFVIEDNHLSGTLPLEMFNLSNLGTLSLFLNSLEGSLPSKLCSGLPRLVLLSLAKNELTGEVPLNLSNCSMLKFLDLSYNNFSGTYIPKDIGKHQMLEVLRLNGNNLKGIIPKEFGNLTMLVGLHLAENNLVGDIPHELGNLHNLKYLSLAFNNLSGHVPKSIYNLTQILVIDFGTNFFEGFLPLNIGSSLPNLKELYLFRNNFSGVIPHSISNSSELRVVELGSNNFIGSIPESLGDLNHLQKLDLTDNQLRSKSSFEDLDFFVFLSKCKELQYLGVGRNPLEGLLPSSIGNLSNSIQLIYAGDCKIKGNLPSGLSNLSSLITLNLYFNQLTGSLPSSIRGLKDLQGLILSSNKLSGFLPPNLCSLHKLNHLNLDRNEFFGSLPGCFGNMTSLGILVLGSNKLNSEVPPSLCNLKDLLWLDLSLNNFSGSLPLEIGNLKAAYWMDLSRNFFSGDLPGTIGDLQMLEHLDLSRNMLQGSIPESFGKIPSLIYLDLSRNDLSGFIPRSLVNLKYLRYFNVSFNKLRGEISSEGPFENFTSQSFIFNDALCGTPKFNVSSCSNIPSELKKHRLMFLILILAPVMGVMLLALVYGRYPKKDKAPNETSSWSILTPEKISYRELLIATDEYNESNLLGAGSFGTVYKGIFNDGRILAIKVFNSGYERAFRSFEAECQVLCNVRHRNITKVISCCSNPDFKALILEFMPNGSLEKWLYSHNYFLDIMQRLNIMIDVARALQYLHFGNTLQVVHCDLKPSNVLLDQNMIAHVSDFGVAKLLDHEQSNAHTKTLATVGYVAPEYGLEGFVSPKCDVYSYGILLMEVFSRKKPHDEMFNDGLSLRAWVNNLIADTPIEVIDPNLLKDGERYNVEKLKCLSSIFEVALNCSVESPKNRQNMENVLLTLENIKKQFLLYRVNM